MKEPTHENSRGSRQLYTEEVAMQLPRGVNLIGKLSIGVACFIVVSLLFKAPQFLFSGNQSAVLGFFVAASVSFMFAGAYVGIGIGLLKLKSWGRILTLVLVAWNVLSTLAELLSVNQSDPAFFTGRNDLASFYMWRLILLSVNGFIG